MHAGNLNKRIFIYKIDDDIKSKMPTVDDLILLRSCLADVRQVSARQQIEQHLEVQDQLYTVKFRYFKNLSSDCYVKLFDKFYFITSMQLDKQNNEITISISYDSRLNKNEKVVS